LQETFRAVHGSAPDIAGKGIANPTAVMLSSLLLLHHLGKDQIAVRVDAAIRKVNQERRHLTRDVGGSASTEEFTTAVIGALA